MTGSFESAVIILAQGRQERLSHLTMPKCLLPVRGTPLLHRTVELVGDRASCYVIASTEVVVGPRCPRETLRQPGSCVLDGLAQTTHLWGTERTIILLGDVFYSDDAMDRIFDDLGGLVFFGTKDLSRTHGEVFALSFSRTASFAVIKALGEVLCRQEPQPDYQGGHLRNLLWQIQGSYQLGAYGKWTPDKRFYHVIDDHTTDFDTPEDLDKIPALEKRLRQTARQNKVVHKCPKCGSNRILVMLLNDRESAPAVCDVCGHKDKFCEFAK